MILDLPRLSSEVANRDLLRVEGKLRSATGILLTTNLPAAVGDVCEIVIDAETAVQAEVIGFGNGLAKMVSFEYSDALRPGLTVIRKGHGLRVPVGDGLLGRVMDGLGRPLDGKGPIASSQFRHVRNETPAAMQRLRIHEPFVTGQRSIDGLLTCGKGQRVGIFAGSGVGKSTLLGEIAKGAKSDVNVLALIGERGREVRPFLEDCLGEKGMARSAVIVSTCDQQPLMRVRAAQTAITMAHHYREQGANVLLMLDSLTRLAMAQRELGLALGEPPSARGYTPSVFQLLADTVERMGNGARGTMTGIVTVLVDGGDMDEPIADAVRSLIDGHIVLDRKLAERGHFPAASIAQSVSRIASDVCPPSQIAAARKVRAIMATYAEAEDLIRIGAYARGSSPQVDRAIELMPAVNMFLRQEINERTELETTRAALEHIASAWPF
jgi:flagellum-specific ATP synthase